MGKWLSALKWLVVAVVLAVFIGLLIKWNRKGGISVEVGFDDRIKLTSQEIRRIEQIGQWEFLSVQSEVVADTLRKGFFTDDRLVAVYTVCLPCICWTRILSTKPVRRCSMRVENGRMAHAAICTTVLTGRCCVNA